jgi:site-specific DNA-methyltransferase (adenine-specific)
MSYINNIDAIDGLKELDDEFADIVLADPPYNVGKDFGISKDDMVLSDYLTWSDKWIKEAVRILKLSGTLFIYGFSEILAHVSVRLPLEHKWLVWHYTNKATPRCTFWQRSHESILCCWKEKNKRIFNVNDVREPYTESFKKNAAGKVRKGTPSRFGAGKETIYNAHENGALPRDVIKIPALAGGAGLVERWFYCKQCNKAYPNNQLDKHSEHVIIKHPTQKPYELTKKLLLSAKPKEDGLVVIPFVGSGSECAVVEDLKMSYIGFENNPDYVNLAKSFLDNRNDNT